MTDPTDIPDPLEGLAPDAPAPAAAPEVQQIAAQTEGETLTPAAPAEDEAAALREAILAAGALPVLAVARLDLPGWVEDAAATAPETSGTTTGRIAALSGDMAWILPVGDPIICEGWIDHDPAAPAEGSVASDSDADGVDDTWTTAGSSGEEDWDEDGVIDYSWSEGGLVETDTDGDGRVDTRVWGEYRTAEDTDGDGVIDLWTVTTAWTEVDTDGDGWADEWSGGDYLEMIDTDADGVPDTTLTWDDGEDWVDWGGDDLVFKPCVEPVICIAMPLVLEPAMPDMTF